MRRLLLVSLAVAAVGLAASALPQREAERASAADDQFPAVPGATGQVWTGASAPLDAGGGPLPGQVSAVFEWSNASQAFRFWFRGFPGNFNTLSALDQGGFYFFQSAGGFQVTMPGSDSYTAAAAAPFATQPGATGKLWAGGFTDPATLPQGISAVFRWNNANQSFDFWFRGFPANFNTLAGMAAGEFYFLQSSGGVQIVPLPGPAAGSSAALIDQALAAGDLEPLPGATPGETALVYKVQAGFGGPIPSAYVGTADEEEVGWLHEARQAFPTLSDAAQDALRPYLLPPAEPGSWDQLLNPAPLRAPVVWHSVSGPRVKVWWRDDRPSDEAKAQSILDEVENTIWPELVGLMGETHAPPTDAACANNGGDGKFDIYLVGSLPDAGGFNVMSDCSPLVAPYPSYVVVTTAVGTLPQLNSVVAHEFMHAVQNTYAASKFDAYSWLNEATAKWAEDYVYPAANAEHASIARFFMSLQRGGSLHSFIYTTGPQYGAYLWFLFLDRHLNNPQIVRDIWDASSPQVDSLAAMAAALGGDSELSSLWSLFTSYLPNYAPANHFQTWDGIPNHYSAPSFNLGVGDSELLDTRVSPLGVSAYTVLTQDSGPDIVMRITNPLAGGNHSTASVWVVAARNDGTYESPANLTNVSEKTFCATSTAAGVYGLLVYAGNSSTSSALTTDPLTVEISEDACCPPGNPARNGNDQCPSGSITGTFDYEYNRPDIYTRWTSHAVITFELPPGDVPGGNFDGYVGVSGTVSWTVTVNTPVCSGGGSGSYQVGPDMPVGARLAFNYVPGTYSAYGENNQALDWVTFDCLGSPSGVQSMAGFGIALTTSIPQTPAILSGSGRNGTSANAPFVSWEIDVPFALP